MNALIFLVPEDIVDVRAKLVRDPRCMRHLSNFLQILTFVGSLMSMRT